VGLGVLLLPILRDADASVSSGRAYTQSGTQTGGHPRISANNRPREAPFLVQMIHAERWRPARVSFRYLSEKETHTVIMTGTATPLSSVGVNSHWRTASSAA